MKNKAIIILTSTLLLGGCGQSGPLYLSAPSDASTTSGVQQQHINTNENNKTKQQSSANNTTTYSTASNSKTSTQPYANTTDA